MINQISLIAPKGNTINVVASGAGQPLVLLHGFPLDHRLWQKQLAALSPHLRLIAIELRGFGKSTLGNAAYSLEDLADDVECIRTHLADGEDIHLCGLSMGGYVAFEYWRRYRKNLKSLILANTKPDADTEAARASRLSMADSVGSTGTWEAVSGMLPKLLGERTRESLPEVVEGVIEQMKACSPECVAAAQRAMADRRDFSELLADIKTPTLAITAADDPIATPEHTQAWSSKIPGARFESFQNAGHLTPMECPDSFNGTVLSFINDVE